MYFRTVIFLIILSVSLVSPGWAQPKLQIKEANQRPIIMLVIDKADSLEFYHSELPAIKGLLSESACGLMNVRSGSGYTNTNSGYLTIGSGNRSVAPGVLNGAYTKGHHFGSITAAEFWSWSSNRPEEAEDLNLLVPEIGWIYNQAESGERTAVPGLLGSIFRENGWKTILIGNIDNSAASNRPAGLLVMDERGIIDKGNISEDINDFDPDFPYGYRFSHRKVALELPKYLHERNLIVIEFGDFARLDGYREEMNPEQFVRLKRQTWKRFDRFMAYLLKLLPKEKADLFVLSPSLSKESWLAKNCLAPLVIRSTRFSPGLLTSGTTHWTGLVANLDVLPTLSALAGLKPSVNFTGKQIRTVKKGNHLKELDELHTRIDTILINQRSMIDWYLGLISFGWGAGCLLLTLKRVKLSGWLLLMVAAAPFVLMILPILPPGSWNVVGFLVFSCFISTICLWFGGPLNRWFLVLSISLWALLTLDQITGWSLIRFSALGYSAASGSRYYGIGNEYMGIYLPVALLTAHFAYEKLRRKWPALIILFCSILILGWPRFGINFGGTLSAMIGFSFYLFSLYGIGLKNRKFWMVTGSGALLVFLFGMWDAFHAPEDQTHVGMFFRLFIINNFEEIGLVIMRKLGMNLRLLIFSPWTRIILLSLAIGIVLQIIKAKTKRYPDNQGLIWPSILVSGIAAFFLNDSGVVALGTCLAFGFSYYLANWTEKIKQAM